MFQNPILKSSVAHVFKRKGLSCFPWKQLRNFQRKKSCSPKTTGKKLCKGPGSDGKTIVLSTIQFFFFFCLCKRDSCTSFYPLNKNNLQTKCRKKSCPRKLPDLSRPNWKLWSVVLSSSRSLELQSEKNLGTRLVNDVSSGGLMSCC